MTAVSRIPERVFRIMRSCETDQISRFPPTEIFNEGWMLRLVLDAMEKLGIQKHPLRFLQTAKWYSEARLASPFRATSRADTLAEGFTHADGVVGHFDFHEATKAGLRLEPAGRQFVVIEAKMFSNLSAGTKNAPAYNQAARNVACMAAAMEQAGRQIDDFDSVGFFVLAPSLDRRRAGSTNLESCLAVDAIRLAVHQRIASYESAIRHEAAGLRRWETEFFLPLVDRLDRAGSMAVLSWEDCIGAIGGADGETGVELAAFYQRCLSYTPRSFY